jgi:hypothetical protein
MDKLHQSLERLNGRFGEHAVAEIENMSRPAAGRLDHPSRAIFNDRPRR